MLKMRRPCSVSHSVHAIRESRIAASAIEQPDRRTEELYVGHV
jgi:hypothetical protein